MSAPSRQPAGSSDRAFGFVFCGVFALVGLWPLLSRDAPRTWALVLAAVFLALALLRPALLAPLNRAWLRFGLLLHRIVSPVALGILFFGVLTPTALLMAALRKRPLKLGLDRKAASYWIPRHPPGPSGGSLKDQF